MENIIASYVTENLFEPSEALAELSRSSSVYIAEQVHATNSRILELDKIDVIDWTDEEYAEYNSSMFRRLRLMQIDVLSLCNTRYLEYYLRDLKKI